MMEGVNDHHWPGDLDGATAGQRGVEGLGGQRAGGPLAAQHSLSQWAETLGGAGTWGVSGGGRWTGHRLHVTSRGCEGRRGEKGGDFSMKVIQGGSRDLFNRDNSG